MKAKSKTSKKWMTKLSLILASLGCAVGGLTWADVPQTLLKKKQDLAIHLEAKKVVRQADGQETLQSAQMAFPGEIVQYDAQYLNQSDRLLKSVSPVLPIPQGMQYVPQSAQPAPAEASLDGRLFHPIPLKRTVTLPSGVRMEQEVSPTEYRALRWHAGDLAAGAELKISARTTVSGGPAR